MNEIAGEIRNDNGDTVVISSRDGDYQVQYIPGNLHTFITDKYYDNDVDAFDAIRKFLVGGN